MSTPTMGHQAQMATITESTYATSPGACTEGFVFVSNGVKKTGVIVERDGIRGFRDHVSTDTRTGPYSVGGTIVLEPTPEDLAIWLPRILGGTPSGTAYGLAETIPSFKMDVLRHSGTKGMGTYLGCKVNRATFSCSKGQIMRLSMDVVGSTETLGTGSGFPSVTPSVTQPYIFSDFVATFVGSTREIESFDLTIDNALVTDRFMNSTTITKLPEGDRIVTLRTTHAHDSTYADLLEQSLTGTTGTLVATNAAYSTTFTFGILQVPSETPTVESKGEVMLTLNMVARRTGSTPSLAVTHDSTP